MDRKICSECGTENENDYIYCKNCGALLTAAPKPENEQPEHKLTAEAAPAPKTAPESTAQGTGPETEQSSFRPAPEAALPHPTEYRRRK